MSYRELNNWWKYLSEEPTLADRIEVQLAKINYYIASFMSDKNNRPKFEDFLIRKPKIKKEDSKLQAYIDDMNKKHNK